MNQNIEAVQMHLAVIAGKKAAITKRNALADAQARHAVFYADGGYYKRLSALECLRKDKSFDFVFRAKIGVFSLPDYSLVAGEWEACIWD